MGFIRSIRIIKYAMLCCNIQQFSLSQRQPDNPFPLFSASCFVFYIVLSAQFTVCALLCKYKLQIMYVVCTCCMRGGNATRKKMNKENHESILTQQ